MRRSFSRTFGPVDLALFSAATWNPHLIHLDRVAAQADGFEGLVVQSHLLPASVLAFLDDEALSEQHLVPGDRRHLRAASWHNDRAVVAGREVAFVVDGQVGEAEAWTWRATVDGLLVAEGSVSIGARGG